MRLRRNSYLISLQLSSGVRRRQTASSCESFASTSCRSHHRFIRGRIAPHLDLKFAPDLRFFIDNTFDEFGRIDAILRSERVQRDLNHDEDEE